MYIDRKNTCLYTLFSQPELGKLSASKLTKFLLVKHEHFQSQAYNYPNTLMNVNNSGFTISGPGATSTALYSSVMKEENSVDFRHNSLRSYDITVLLFFHCVGQ